MARGMRFSDGLVDYFDARLGAMTSARHRLGIGELDARAMLFLAEHPGTRPSVLREHLGVSSAAVTILIDRLVARSVLRRDPDPDDRRANRVSLTVDLDSPPWDELGRFDRDVDRAAAGLPSTTSQTARGVLDAVIAAAHRARQSESSSR